MSEVTPEQINKLTESINKLSGGNSSAKPATGGSPGVGYFDNLQKQAGDAASP